MKPWAWCMLGGAVFVYVNRWLWKRLMDREEPLCDCNECIARRSGL